jgi:hypothetical protein
MTGHSIFPPSSMHCLVKCPGSFRLSKLYPEREDSPAAREGTAWAETCANLARGTPVRVGTLATNGVAITDEMIEGAELYADTVPFDFLPRAHIEERVDIPAIHPKCFGTPDLWYADENEIYVKDGKWGHVFVDEYENHQLMAYASGIINHLGEKYKSARVSMTIVQPRCYSSKEIVRTWSCMASDLYGKINQMRIAAANAESDNTQCNTGAHCHHCSAKRGCLSFQRSIGKIFDFTGAPVPFEIPIDVKGAYLRTIQHAEILLKDMKAALAEEIENSIRNGTPVSGYELEPTKNRVIWTKSFLETTALGDLLDVNMRKDSLMTPLQAKAALKKKGIDESVISDYCESVPGALKLTTTDSNKTRRIFGAHKE